MTATLPFPCAAKLCRDVIAENVRLKELIDKGVGAMLVGDDPGDTVVAVVLLELLPQADATRTTATTSAAKARLLVTGKSFPPVLGPEPPPRSSRAVNQGHPFLSRER
jgi:hypothetical protein